MKGFLLFLFLSPLLARGQMHADSMLVAVAPEYDQVSRSHRFWFGENYRKLWATPVEVRVLNLATERGGLTIVKEGGGMQTRSLRFKDASGKEWVLRTIQKYPERALPAKLRPTITRDILQDQVSTGHPFGALAVPLLAEALGLPHAHPEIVYVGDDPALEDYRKTFANAVYLFEEREPLEVTNTDNTLKVQQKVEANNDNSVEQIQVLRARLLDFLIGDWDRHQDNWRWIPDKTKEETRYIPIPRDRDKAFYKTSGVFPWILSHQWLKSNLQPYSVDVRDIQGWNFNARYFDRYFLTGLDEQDWKREIRFVQSSITDSLARQALMQMPPNIYKINGEELLRILKGRRDHLEKMALEYFRFISKTVDIPLSKKREIVNVDYHQRGKVELTVKNKKKDGSSGHSVYHRVFDPAVTNEIRVYGLAGGDSYEVKGGYSSPIRVRLIGGTDRDTFLVKSSNHKSRLYIYDRKERRDNLPARSDARTYLSADTGVHSFDRESFRYNRFGPMALINYNPDQGLQLRIGIIDERQGFRKDPYSVKHELWTNYSTGRKSFFFSYDGHFRKVIGENDLRIKFNSWGPNNLTNFFGLGNQTEFKRHDQGGIDYYRNRYDYFNGDVRLQRNISKKMKASVGLAGEYYTSAYENNLHRFFNAYNSAHPSEQVFADRYYAGVAAGLAYDTRDNESMPSSGINWNTDFTVRKQLNGARSNYSHLLTSFSFYLHTRDSSLVIANRIGGGTTWGSPAFFQMMQLGGVQTLRGFHTYRFTGKTMVYHNLDLRLKLFNFTSYLFPGSVGMVGFHDTGRVWVPGESSERWHHGYGGGLYIVPADLILIQAAVGFSKEGSLPYISIGFSF